MCVVDNRYTQYLEQLEPFLCRECIKAVKNMLNFGPTGTSESDQVTPTYQPPPLFRVSLSSRPIVDNGGIKSADTHVWPMCALYVYTVHSNTHAFNNSYFGTLGLLHLEIFSLWAVTQPRINAFPPTWPGIVKWRVFNLYYLIIIYH